MEKNSELYKHLSSTGYSKRIMKYQLETYLKGIWEDGYLRLNMGIVRKIQKKYGHNDQVMIAIIDYVLYISKGILYLRYIEYLSAMIIGERIDSMKNLLKYLYNVKPLQQEIECRLDVK
ncbi:hypothetical protein COL68_17750 [Bacillus wiedmannii]|uniref:Uncharacterized protein n=1 Tax=Bacillus wiedmannii TaxID=1890302 RepID=A0A0J7EG43_9BACI|nr:hypothetical protein [Bacillus wiedmannii]KMP91157.1 hypothetical protein TU65_26460 [Bacillus wiedmannii]MCU5517611.1 hypothetical protein [Bacillus wiedmannii]PEL58164.1 hypothetical protein CN622_21725 [Bacillus wiedmannii]PEM53357.1 hypothetical protein CN618_06030 [Bacillus wiedmannii]PEO17180.1 hypothetical protein CN562_04835 [Bacillus wiedmannii]